MKQGGGKALETGFVKIFLKKGVSSWEREKRGEKERNKICVESVEILHICHREYKTAGKDGCREAQRKERLKRERN